jgi:hypothetical protein
MAEFTSDDATRVRQILDSLLGDDIHRFRGELEEGFSIIDVESHAADFRNELQLLQRVGRFPAMELASGPPVPVSLSVWGLSYSRDFGGLSGFPAYPYAPYSADLIHFYEYLLSRYGAEELFRGSITISLPQARESFFSRATTFLATRLAAAKSLWPGKGGPPGGPTLSLPQRLGGPRTNNVVGCYFSVSSNSPGLSAYWSGAYYISPNYLGAPTSPAVGILQAGTYIFGVKGGAYGNAIQWDAHGVCSLPGIPTIHLQY